MYARKPMTKLCNRYSSTCVCTFTRNGCLFKSRSFYNHLPVKVLGDLNPETVRGPQHPTPTSSWVPDTPLALILIAAVFGFADPSLQWRLALIGPDSSTTFTAPRYLSFSRNYTADLGRLANTGTNYRGFTFEEESASSRWIKLRFGTFRVGTTFICVTPFF